MVMVMANIYINCGEYDKAIDELEQILALETVFTTRALKFMPQIDKISDMPRYKEMIERYKI